LEYALKSIVVKINIEFSSGHEQSILQLLLVIAQLAHAEVYVDVGQTEQTAKKSKFFFIN